jgi:hypothetical protein
LREFFVGRKKEAYDHEDAREHEQNAQDTVQALPNGRFTPRAEIAIARMIH